MSHNLITCSACRFRGTCLKGTGNPRARLMVVGDAPQKKDIQQQIPFSGKAGQALKGSLAQFLGIDPQTDVFYTYALRGDRKDDVISSKELQACRTWLWQEMQAVQPQLVLASGNLARQSVLSDDRLSFREARGTLQQDLVFGWSVFVTYAMADVDKFSSFTPTGQRLAPTGSVPWFYVRDLQKLHRLLQETTRG